MGMEVNDVKSIKLFEMGVEARTKKDAFGVAKQACERLLANPVIHNYRITIKE